MRRKVSPKLRKAHNFATCVLSINLFNTVQIETSPCSSFTASITNHYKIAQNCSSLDPHFTKKGRVREGLRREVEEEGWRDRTGLEQKRGKVGVGKVRSICLGDRRMSKRTISSHLFTHRSSRFLLLNDGQDYFCLLCKYQSNLSSVTNFSVDLSVPPYSSVAWFFSQ